MGGTSLTVKYAIPHLRQTGGGSIVIVSSINGTRTFSNFGFTAYSCSKAAQVAFAKMAAEVARVILFLASDEASYITGTEIYVDGALSLF